MNKRTGQLLTIRRGPCYEADAVEAHQSTLRSNPQISISSLSDCLRSSAEEAVLDAPRGVGVLRNSAIWSKRKSTRAKYRYDNEESARASQDKSMNTSASPNKHFVFAPLPILAQSSSSGHNNKLGSPAEVFET